MLTGKKIVLGVSGGIAAYKMANVASMLSKLHADIHVVMTENATHFITPETFEVLTGNHCYTDTFDRCMELHVHLYSMESDGDSYSHDDIVSYGLDSMTLTLYADGTASLGFGEETEQFQWKEGMLYSDDEEIAFTVENGMLTVSMDTESMVFERVKDAPEKMEVQNPEETTGTPTDDTEVSGTDFPQQ